MLHIAKVDRLVVPRRPLVARDLGSATRLGAALAPRPAAVTTRGAEGTRREIVVDSPNESNYNVSERHAAVVHTEGCAAELPHSCILCGYERVTISSQ